MRSLKHTDPATPGPLRQALDLLGRSLIADRRGGARVSPVFRVLAAVLGPVMIVCGSGLSALSIYMLATEGLDPWMELFSMFALAALMVPFGFFLLFVARKGRDPLTRAEDPPS